MYNRDEDDFFKMMALASFGAKKAKKDKEPEADKPKPEEESSRASDPVNVLMRRILETKDKKLYKKHEKEFTEAQKAFLKDGLTSAQGGAKKQKLKG